MNPRMEPVAIGAGIIALVQAILVMLSAMDIWTLTDVQQASINGVITAAVALAGGVYVRSQVTPVERAEAKQRAAVKAAVSEMVPPSRVVAETNPESPTGVVAGPASQITTGSPVTVHDGSVHHEA